jgi:transcriptional regulator with XRE-family HTH domain
MSESRPSASQQLGRLADNVAGATGMDAQVNEVIARRVEDRRNNLGMTQAELARASGVRSSVLDALERKGRGCSAADLWRVAQVLDVSVGELCPPPPAASANSPPRTFRDENEPAPIRRIQPRGERGPVR